MSHFHISTDTVIVAAGATERTWAEPIGEPSRAYSIFCNSQGAVVGVGGVDWVVYYGGRWAGTPFAATSTHSGGVVVQNNTFAAGSEIAHVAFQETKHIPTNNRQSSHEVRLFSTPTVIEFTNNTADPITIYVTFINDVIGNVSG